LICGPGRLGRRVCKGRGAALRVHMVAQRACALGRHVLEGCVKLVACIRDVVERWGYMAVCLDKLRCISVG